MAINTTNKKATYINNYIDSVLAVLKDISRLKEARVEWDALGYTSAITDADFTGNSAHITQADLINAIVSAQAITDLLAANGNGHNTNLYKLVR